MSALTVFTVRNVLPLATSVLATLFLSTAVPHDLVPEPGDAAVAAVARAELQRCVRDGRDTDDCLDEADGKALIERADDATRRAPR